MGRVNSMEDLIFYLCLPVFITIYKITFNMKLPISKITYKKLITNLFSEILNQLEVSALNNGGIAFYEIGMDKYCFYPNQDTLSSGKLKTPNFELFEYLSDTESLKKFLLKRLNDKYNEEEYDDLKEVNYKLGNENITKDFSDEVFNRFYYNFEFQRLNLYPEVEKKFTRDYFTEFSYESLKNNMDFKVRNLELGTDETYFYTPLTRSAGYNSPLTHFSIANVVTIDLLHFTYNCFPERLDDLKQGTSGHLLNEVREVKLNPFINLMYELLVYRFLMLENELDKITFFNDGMSNTLPTDDRHLSENHLKILIELFYSSIIESDFLQVMPSMRTDKKVADLFSKAMILVLNDRFVDNTQFTSKISDLFTSEVDLQSQQYLQASNYEQLDVIFKNSKIPFKGLNVSNISMLFHLLKEHEVTHDLNNNQLALIISLLTGKSTQKLSRALGQLGRLKSYKSKASDKYTDELIYVLEKIINAIKK
jgi:hypothetical protein